MVVWIAAMLGSFVNNIKNRLAVARVGDESRLHSPAGGARSRNIFLKIVNASYALVSQHQDDAYCNENLFMLPRVYSQKTEHVGGVWSPVSLKPPEKSLDELDNVVEKFMRCIEVENSCDSSNVNRMKNAFPIFSTLRLLSLTIWLMNFFPVHLWCRCRGRMIVKRFVVDWRWAKRMITSPT